MYIYIIYPVQLQLSCHILEVPPWLMYFWSFQQLSENSCISVRLGQVAPNQPPATHTEAEASAVWGKSLTFCLKWVLWGGGCAWGGSGFAFLCQCCRHWLWGYWYQECCDHTTQWNTSHQHKNIHTKRSFLLSPIPRNLTLSYHPPKQLHRRYIQWFGQSH